MSSPLSTRHLIALLSILALALWTPACSGGSTTDDGDGGVINADGADNPDDDASAGDDDSSSGGGAKDGSGGGDDDTPSPEPDLGPCEPQCEGMACGDDGCGGDCGTCADGQTCSDAGQCEGACEPQCEGMACGDDGCGGSCGTCEGGETCNDAGQCVGDGPCEPQCEGKACGDDGCGNQCGACGSDEVCDADGQCVADSGDPCDPNPCVTPPANSCDGDDVVIYDDVGLCTVADDVHSCTYDTTVETCEGEAVCVDGACQTDTPEPGEFGEDACLIDEMVIAAANEPDDCCFDFDGDGKVDNGVVDLLSSLSSFLGDVDVDQSLADSIADGSVMIVMEGQGIDSLEDDDNVGVNGYVAYTDDAGDLLIQPGSFNEDGLPLVQFLDGTIEGGVAHMGPADFQTSLPLAGIVLSLNVKDARGQAAVSDGGDGYFDMDDGKLGGLLPFGDIVETINLVAAGCECLDLNGGDMFELEDEDAISCGSAFDAANPSCTDADGDVCTGLASIADQKFLVCAIGLGLISPDIDTDFNGKGDHFSIGLRFSGQATEIAGMGEDQTLGGCSDCTGGGGPLSALVHFALFAMIFAFVTRRRRA